MTEETTTEYSAGINWEDSPLFDFARSPRLSLFPDLCRLLNVGWLALHYAGVIKEEKKIKLLDAACGFGELNRIIKSQRIAKGARVQYIGIDIDPRKIKRAEEMMKTGDFRLLPMQEITSLVRGLSVGQPADRDLFDVIVSTESLEHINREAGIRFLADCADILRVGGHFIITCPTPAIHRDNEWHLHEWEVEELTIELAKLPFEVVDQFFMKSPVRILGIPPTIRSRVPNEMLRGVLSPGAADGSVQVWVLRRK